MELAWDEKPKSPEDKQTGPGAEIHRHFGWLAPCLERLLRTNATALPEDCTIRHLLTGVNTPIKWTP